MEEELLNRQPPQSLEAEQAVLGSILIDSRCVTEVVGLLKPEDFSNEVYKTLAENIFNNYEANKVSEPAILLNGFDGEKLRLASEVFYNMEVYDNDEKAFNDLINSIKREKIKRQISQEKDPEKLRKLLSEQAMLGRK